MNENETATFTPTQLQQIAKAESSAEIARLCASFTEQNQIQTGRDERGRFVAAPPAAEVQPPQAYTRIVEINGNKVSFFGSSELDLEKQISAAMKVANQLQENERQQRQPTRFEQQVASEQAVFDRTELDLKFRRGEISASDYIEQTGALETVLAKHGLSVEQLQTASTRAEVQSWQAATQQFVNENPDWPGGQKNLELMAMQIRELGLDDDADKSAALNQAYAALQEKQLLQPYAGDFTPEMIAEITKDMSPAEIIGLYKEANAGKEAEANDIWVQQHSRSGSGLFSKQ